MTIEDDDRAASDGPSWHDRPPVVVAGLAGLLLLGRLVYAVIHLTDDSTRAPGAPSSDLPMSTSRSATSGPSTTNPYAPTTAQNADAI